MSNRIIAIDTSSSTIGLAILEDFILGVGVVSYKSVKLPAKLVHWEGRLSFVRSLIQDFIRSSLPINGAVVEQPPYMPKHSKTTYMILSSYMGVCTEACYSMGIKNVLIRDPNATRNILGVKAHCAKEILLARVVKQFPSLKSLDMKKDNDALDAIGLGYSYLLDPTYEADKVMNKKKMKLIKKNILMGSKKQ